MSQLSVIYQTPPKKLLMFGWNMPSPAFLRDNRPLIEQTPFDGVCIKLPASAGGGDVFDIVQWRGVSQPARDAELGVLAAIQPGEKLTDNFVVLYGASTMDWFSDGDWDTVLEHTRFCAHAARISGCKGVCWDAEPYHDINPWRYITLPTRDAHSFAEHVAIVRKRGAQFARALHEGFPGLTVFSLRLLSDYADASPFSQHVFNLRDTQARERQLADGWWSLHWAFINGMLEGLGPGGTLVDGNEEAYYYTSELEFHKIHTELRHDALMFIPPELRDRYRAQYRVGHAVSVGYTSGAWADAISFPDYLRKQALELSPVERARWFEHNTYHALASADEYVWVYSEPEDWWTGERVPPGYAEALVSAKLKHHAGEPLGFEIEARLRAAREAIKARS
jgi:hypothetical protein